MSPELDPERFLIDLFQQAVLAAHPAMVLADFLPANRSGKAIVIGAGKAAGAMAQAFEQAWQGPVSGLVVTRYGHSLPCEFIEVVEAGHPMPDAASLNVADRILSQVQNLTANDQVFVLMSGGGSALLSKPATGISPEVKLAINRALLACGASIDEINCVRKHLSAIKGGRLLAACQPAQVHTLVISDVPGDDPATIASGPTVPDPTTSSMAMDVLKKYRIDVPEPVWNWLHSPTSETVKPEQTTDWNHRLDIIATPQQALSAAANMATDAGIRVLQLGDEIEGESREVAKVHAGLVKSIQRHGIPIAPPCLVLSGGETTVTLKGDGRGGRNAEFLLSLFRQGPFDDRVTAIAADTDGIDGSEDNAGCLLVSRTRALANSQGLNPDKFLERNDGYSFFEQTESLLKTGPTRTNINDFRAILILS